MRRFFAFCVLLFAPMAGQAADATQQARALFEADWQWRLQNQPELATSIGDHRYDARLSDSSLAGRRAVTEHERAMLDQLRAIDRDALAGQDQISYDVFAYDKETALKAAGFFAYNPQPLTQLDGPQFDVPQLIAQMPFATEADYRNYLARLAALPKYIDGLIEQMDEGVKRGWTAPKPTVSALPDQFKQLREELPDGPLSAPLRAIPESIAKPTREKLRAAGTRALQNRVAPALKKLEDYLRATYLPAARESIAASALPGGADYYAFAVARATTTAMSADEIHELGLKEVARLQAEMRSAVAHTGYNGAFSDFVSMIGSDPRFFFPSADALLTAYRNAEARAALALPKLFASVPDEPLEVVAAPELNADGLPAAYYEPGAAGRAAGLVVNTSHLDARPRWQVETLALHEGLPGHHLQAARARAVAGLPAFRRYAWYVAYGEGWATYAESLGPELGMYRDAFSAFGHLGDALLRAARLVVDTGIHARGWSRQRALDYMNANTVNSQADNEAEVDRYIAQPGQALGYQIGQLRIRALRDKAQAALGERFDVRRFHEAVLADGPLPLAILERRIDAWIARERGP